MKILGIETSCDETAAAVVEDGRTVLSNAVRTQIPLHALYGGVVPEIASRAHTEAICAVVQAALDRARLSVSDLDAIAVTARPGLIGALLIGVNFAKALALRENLPLVPVNHLRGHIAAAYLCYPDLKPPFHALVLSGGHTFLCRAENETTFTHVGATRDDAAGEAFDKVARVLGIPYPGGKELQKLADAYSGGDCYALPSPALRDSLYDFSFSGLKTAVINLDHRLSQIGETLNREKLAASFCKIVQEGLCDRLQNLVSNAPVQTLVFAGGVAANEGLRSAIKTFCDQSGVRFCPVDAVFCGDNAAMIASQGYYEYLAGVRAKSDLNASARAEIET